MITTDQIKSYMNFRGQTYPDAKNAFDFAITEIGEALEVFENFPRLDYRELGFELADTYQMLQIASVEQTGQTLEAHFEIHQPSVTVRNLPDYLFRTTRTMTAKVMDAFLRDNPSWKRNNPNKEVPYSEAFAESFVYLSKAASVLPVEDFQTLDDWLLSKWKSKGFSLET